MQTPMTPRSAGVPDDEWGPTVQGGRRRRRWPLVLVLLLLLPLVYGAALAVRLTTAMEQLPVTALSGHGGGQLNILVTGSDSRAELTPEERRELTTGSAGGERTDSIFVLSIRGGHAAILAFPRDLYVTRCDGSRGRINAALAIDGVDCLIDTVESVSGIPLHHWVMVGFGGFRDIVDAVGGVELCLDRAINDRKAGIDLPAGCQVLGGADALGFVRTRSIDNDLGRIQRQQQFLGALARELATPATVVNPVRAFQSADAVGGALTTDNGFGPLGLVRLARGARALAAGNAVTETVPATPATIGGASVLEIRPSEADALFAAFRTGAILGTADATVDRADVQVRVLNGAGVSGLAATTRDALGSLGYQVVGIGDADATDRSLVRYPAGQRAHAELLANDVPGQVDLEEASVDVVTLILGTSALPG